MTQAGQKISPHDQRMVECLHRYIRPEAKDSLLVTGDKNDHLLETDLIYAYPRIPAMHQTNASVRFGLNATTGVCLAVTLDMRKDVPMDNCALTSQGLFWWDSAERKVVNIPYATIKMAYPSPDYPNRGVKISCTNGREIMVRMYLHDALLCAMANFLCAAHTLASKHLVDLNNAPAEQLATLPMMTMDKALLLVEERNLMQGFKRMEQVGETLHMHHQELSLLAASATLKPYRAPKQRARKVDF